MTSPTPPPPAEAIAEIRAAYHRAGKEMMPFWTYVPDDLFAVGTLLRALDTATARAEALEAQLRQARQEAGDTEVEKLGLIRELRTCQKLNRIGVELRGLPTPPSAGATQETI